MEQDVVGLERRSASRSPPSSRRASAEWRSLGGARQGALQASANAARAVGLAASVRSGCAADVQTRRSPSSIVAGRAPQCQTGFIS